MIKFFAKNFDVLVTAAGQSIKKTFELDKSVKTILRYTLLSNREDLMYYRGAFGLDINKDEVIEEGYSVKLIMCWASVAADLRLKSMGRKEAGNGLINFQYTDTSDGLTVFQPYTVTLHLEGERVED